MNTPDLDLDGIIPKSYVLRPNPAQPTWALQVTSGNTSDVVRIPIPTGVSRVHVSWNGPGSINVEIGGLWVATIPSGGSGQRRIVPMIEVPNDQDRYWLQLIGRGLSSSDLSDRFTAGVIVYPISTGL